MLKQRSHIFNLIFLISLFCHFTGKGQNLPLADEYYQKADFDKAIFYYEKTFKNEELAISDYYENFRESYIQVKDYSAFEKVLKKIKKQDPQNYLYRVDDALNKISLGKTAQAETEFKLLEEEAAIIPILTKKLAAIYLKRSKYDRAVSVYKSSRIQQNNPIIFSVELAGIYGRMGKTDEMSNELLNSLILDNANLDYVEEYFQSKFSSTAEYEKLLETIYVFVGKYPNQIVFNELLVWYHLQQNDYYNAFIEARAIDKKNYRLRGTQLIELGDLAVNNQKYKNAIEIYQYVITTYPEERHFVPTTKKMIEAKEMLIKSKYPIDQLEVKKLIADYEDLLAKTKYQQHRVGILRNIAMLEAYYLYEYQEAINLLDSLSKMRGVSINEKAEMKIILGDIHILINEPWESTLYYSQAERLVDDSPVAHRAKLKNAKLSFYQGDFELAKSHLAILKRATSREISNNALKLNLLIMDNLNLDTSDAALSMYARADLLIFQNKINEALITYDSLLTEFPNHTLTDEVLWEKAQLYKKLTQYDKSVACLEKIVLNYKEDILADDATFTLAQLFQYQLNDPTTAMEYYRKVLLNYPGSIYIVESRKQYRLLRGDKL